MSDVKRGDYVGDAERVTYLAYLPEQRGLHLLCRSRCRGKEIIVCSSFQLQFLLRAVSCYYHRLPQGPVYPLLYNLYDWSYIWLPHPERHNTIVQSTVWDERGRV